MFSKCVDFVPIYLKIGTHRAFFKTSAFFISTNNEDIGKKFSPDTYDHTLIVY